MLYNYNYVDEPLLNETIYESEKILLKNLNLKSVVYSNGFILPTKFIENEIGGGVVTEKGEFILNTSVHEGIGRGYEFDINNIEHINKTVIYIGLINPCWGHFITDGLKKIWYILENNCNYDLVYTTINNEPLPHYLQSVFEILNINSKTIHIDKVTCFSSIIIPDNSFIYTNSGRFYDSKFKQTIDKIKENTPISKEQYENVYFSRSKLKNNKDKGEYLIEREFKKQGYHIFYPEKMTFIEQVKVLSNCKKMVATEGSVSHNALFMKEGAELVLLRKAPYINSYQLTINQIQNLNVTIIDCNLSVFAQYGQEWNGPFFIYCNSNISSYLGIAKKKFPIMLFISYFINSLKSGILIRNCIKNHFYLNKLSCEIKNNSFLKFIYL